MNKINELPSGAIRDNIGKINFFLIPQIFLERLAVHFTNGDEKHGRNNWRQGLPLHWFVESIYRHLNKLIIGDTSEDHLAALGWNIATFMWTQNELKQNRLPDYLWTIGFGAKYSPEIFEEWHEDWKVSKVDFSDWFSLRNN